MTRGSLTAIIDPLGHQTSIAHSINGMPFGDGSLGNMAQFAYDGTDLAALTDALGIPPRFVDGAGRIAAITDPLGRLTRYAYNALNEIVQKVDPAHGVTSIGYDLNGNPSA